MLIEHGTHACCVSSSRPERRRAGAGAGDDYMSAMDLPPSESESGSDAEAPGTSHNPNRPCRRAAPGASMGLAWMAAKLLFADVHLHLYIVKALSRPLPLDGKRRRVYCARNAK